MKDDKDLFDAWQSATVEAEHHEVHLENLKSSSTDIFQRIRKNMIIELTVSVLVAIFFPFTFYNEGSFFYLVAGMMAVALVITAKIYGQCLIDIKRINDTSIISSLRLKENILSRYIKQLKLSIYIITPIAYVISLFFSPESREITLRFILISSAIGLPFLALFVWGMNRYVYWLYGKHLKRLRNLIADWETEEGGRI